MQHADCASFDIDRAPFTTPANRDFFSDGFCTNGQIVAGTNSISIAADEKMGGFYEEDSNYYLDPNVWQPWYFAGTCSYLVDDTVYDPVLKPGTDPTQCSTNRYRMLCNIGPPIVSPPNDEVYAITPSIPPLTPPNPDPLLALGREGIAANRDVRMLVGPLAWSWNRTHE